MPRPIYAEFSQLSLRQNYLIAKNIGCKNNPAKVWAVIKANGYGHGVLRCATTLANIADGFALIEIDYAIALREAGITQPIFLLEGFFEPSDIQICIKNKLQVAVHTFEQLQILASGKHKYNLPLSLKFNTGMNRLGFSENEIPKILTQLEKLANKKSLGPITLMTHFATADDAHGIRWQQLRFNRIIEAFIGKYPFNVSVANSATILRYLSSSKLISNDVNNWRRAGIMLYGGSPFANKTAKSLDLQAVMSLKSKIIAVQEISANETVGYGGKFRARKKTRVGVVACGYGDGYMRCAPEGTPILVNNQKTKIIGRVSMDMLTCDLTNLPNAGVDSEVELWGKNLSADEVAKHCGTISYELFCGLTPRVPVVEL